MKSDRINPILKWPGGKRWLVKQILPYLNRKYYNYIEPFLGGGAFFFLFNPKQSILSDINSDLINCYNALKINSKKVFNEYSKFIPTEKGYYYIRDSFSPKSIFEASARLIFLLNYSWNGLYRVNLSGKFNVPYNSKKRKYNLSENDFYKVQEVLENAEILNQDFEYTINKAKKESLIFADPPYFEYEKEGFGKYNTVFFTDDDQKRLSNSLRLAENRGSSWILTNGCYKKVTKYYSDYNIYIVPRTQVIAADSCRRKVIPEYVVLSNSKCFDHLRNYFSKFEILKI